MTTWKIDKEFWRRYGKLDGLERIAAVSSEDYD
jgi:hypothetical protein